MRLPKLKALVALLGGRAERSVLLDRRLVTACDLRFHRPVIGVALDGEIVRLATPLRVRCVPGALRLRSPATHLTEPMPEVR